MILGICYEIVYACQDWRISHYTTATMDRVTDPVTGGHVDGDSASNLSIAVSVEFVSQIGILSSGDRLSQRLEVAWREPHCARFGPHVPQWEQQPPRERARAATKLLLLTLATLRQAIAKRQPTKGATHHRNRGCTLPATTLWLPWSAIDAQISLSIVGNPSDHAKAESLFRPSKMEAVDLKEDESKPPPRSICWSSSNRRTIPSNGTPAWNVFYEVRV